MVVDIIPYEGLTNDVARIWRRLLEMYPGARMKRGMKVSAFLKAWDEGTFECEVDWTDNGIKKTIVINDYRSEDDKKFYHDAFTKSIFF